jgi:hypothetical protein
MDAGHPRAVSTSALGRLGRGWRQLAVVLRQPNLRRLAVASAVSTTARWTYMVALLVVAYDQAGAVGLAVLGLARTVPTMVAVPLLGAVGSRVPAARMLALTYAARAAVIAVAALAMTWHAAAFVVVIAAFDAVLGVFRRPVQASLLPFVTHSAGDLVAANVATSTGDGLAAVVGPLVGGAILAATGPAPVLVLSALGFAAAAVLAGGVRAPGATVSPAAASTLHALRAGAAAIAGSGIPRLVVAGFLVESLVTGALGVLLVPTATELLGSSAAGVGPLYAALGLGGLGGAIVAIVAIGPGRLAGTFLVALAGCGLPLVILAAMATPASAVSMLAVAGVAGAALDVAGYSLLQRTLTSKVRANAMAMFEGLAQAALGLGGIVVPIMIAVLGVAGALGAFGASLAVVAALLAPSLLRHRDVLATRSADVDRLRRVALFEPLPLAVVEELAAGATALEFGTGSTLIKEGDPGDLYYVITAGQIVVSREGRHVADVAAGGGVGEIALMRNVPRTATVVAAGHVHALAINGPDFLAAITGHPRSLQAAVRAADERLEELARV